MDSLTHYIRKVYDTALLTVEQETELLARRNDKDAMRVLIESHLRFVIYVAKQYQGYGQPLADLIQEGNVGLIKAISKFSPTFGVRLCTFAVYWIRSEIQEFAVRNHSMVKATTTKDKRKLFFNLRSMKTHFGWSSRAELQKIADELNVDIESVIEMESYMNAQDAEIEDRCMGNEKLNPAVLVEPELVIKSGISALDDRARDIITKRYLAIEPATLQQLATEHGISIERVRQIEQYALKQMRSLIDE